MEKLQCSVCGGALVMNDTGDRAVCESCGMSFKKETIKKMIMELSGPIKVEGIQNSDSLVDRAETFLQMGERQKAMQVYQKITDEYPSDYRGWWGLTRIMDWVQYFYENGPGECAMPQVCKRAVEFAPEEVKREIEAFFQERKAYDKPTADVRLRQEEAVREAKAAEAQRALEEKAAEEKRKQAEQEERAQKMALYQQALAKAKKQVEDAENRVKDLYWDINHLPDQIKREKKMGFDTVSHEDRRPITFKNILALVLGIMLNIAGIGAGFHPVGTPLVALLGLGLPLLFIARRVLQYKNHRDHASELEQKLKQEQQALPQAKKDLEQAQAALQAVKESKPF